MVADKLRPHALLSFFVIACAWTWTYVIVFPLAVLAVLLLVATPGRLGYSPFGGLIRRSSRPCAATTRSSATTAASPFTPTTSSTLQFLYCPSLRKAAILRIT